VGGIIVMIHHQVYTLSSRNEIAYHDNPKHAAHSVRLLRQGLECLQHQELLVDRRDAGDAEELFAIRKGDYTYEAVIQITDALFLLLEEAYGASTLPHTVDRELVHDLCSRWGQDYHNNH
jgi:hypothetical protein